ncbi:jg17757 [Pararge aegeria aegeria]|uniref:Jg17757 protein n=1 Tax=Pararge aegeria aegeria TaxID=348720 RepID=A0A8S4RCV3_9NEOP|nr:jg17757 [Pararge aegeria aegeria]
MVQRRGDMQSPPTAVGGRLKALAEVNRANRKRPPLARRPPRHADCKRTEVICNSSYTRTKNHHGMTLSMALLDAREVKLLILRYSRVASPACRRVIRLLGTKSASVITE